MLYGKTRSRRAGTSHMLNRAAVPGVFLASVLGYNKKSKKRRGGTKKGMKRKTARRAYVHTRKHRRSKKH
tara:strand:- start:360 stop:569 length:210 start_codon:yes stop_codon:yes gene_type:complete